jgi:hypothetical protein
MHNDKNKALFRVKRTNQGNAVAIKPWDIWENIQRYNINIQ